MKRNKDCNLYAKGGYKQEAMSEVVASSGLSDPNSQRLMKQTGSLVRSYLGTHSATFRVPRATKRKAPEELCANTLVWPINARGRPAGGSVPTYCSYHLEPNLRSSQVALKLPQASPGPHQLHRDANLNSIPPTSPQARPHQPLRLGRHTARPIPSHPHHRPVPWLHSDNQDGENQRPRPSKRL